MLDSPILLVEDDEDDIALLRGAFEENKISYPIQVVQNGEEAIDYLAGRGQYSDRARFPVPKLVLLDLNMPKKTGFEVLQWVRQQPILKRLPVVVLTSSTQPPDINRAYELGVNSYLVKAAKFEDLVRMTKTVQCFWLTTNEPPSLEAKAGSYRPAIGK